MGGYNHKKGCPCKLCVPQPKQRKPRTARQEQTDVKTIATEQADKVVKVEQVGGSSGHPQENGRANVDGNLSQIPVRQGAEQEIKTIGSPDSPAKTVGQKSELDRLMNRLNSGSVNPPDAPVDKTAPVSQPAGQTVKVDDKPPAPPASPASGTSADLPMDVVYSVFGELLTAAPHNLMNFISKSRRYSLTEKQHKQLYDMTVRVLKRFELNMLDNKWADLAGLVGLHGMIMMENAGVNAAPKPPEKKEDKKTDEQPAKNAGGPGPGATGGPAEPEKPEAIRLV